jgi:tRNA (guanine-N7-)-methyltransferase
MPHIFVKNFDHNKLSNTIKYSESDEHSDEVEFNFIAKSEKKENEVFQEFLILTTFSNVQDKYKTQFFLKAIERENNIYLIKPDKKTRVSPNYFAQKSLDLFAKVLNLEIIKSNLNIEKSIVLKNTHFKNSNKNLKKINYFNNELFDSDYFKNRDLLIEIGFGSGRHILHQANQHKNNNTLIIGIEIHKPSIEQLLKQIEIQELENIWVLDFDARHFFEILPTSSVNKIFVHFPVPWDKKPERRIIKTNFLKEVKRILKYKGTLELRTDSENYFQNSFNVFNQEYLFDINIQKNSSQVGVVSKYEDRWKKQQKNIYQVTFKNIDSNFKDKIQENYLISNSQNCQFEFKNIFETPEDLNKIKQTILSIKSNKEKLFFSENDFFIRFSRFYDIKNNENLVLIIIFGSYDYPETLFVNIDLTQKVIKYLIKKPLNTFANRKAHSFLKNIFKNNINMN